MDKQQAYKVLRKSLRRYRMTALEDFVWIWDEYALAKDEVLSSDAKEIKAAMLALFHRPGDGQLIFAAPQYIGDMAERARKVTDLESQVVGLTEALRGVLPWLEEFHPMCADEPCVVFLAWKQAKDALSLTPSDLAALESKLSRALTRIKEMHTTECAIWRQCQADDGRTPGISAIEKALDYEVHRTVKFLNEIEPIGTTVPKEV